MEYTREQARQLKIDFDKNIELIKAKELKEDTEEDLKQYKIELDQVNKSIKHEEELHEKEMKPLKLRASKLDELIDEIEMNQGKEDGN